MVFCLFIHNISWKHDRRHQSLTNLRFILLITRITSTKMSRILYNFYYRVQQLVNFIWKYV